MYKFLSKNRGSVTILLSIILIPILSLSSLMIEIGRAASAKAIVKEAENSSVMSLLSAYEEALLNDYDLLGVYVDDEDALNEKFLEYMIFNSDNDGPKANSFSSVYNVKETSVTGIYNLAQAKVLMHSLLESGKYTQAYAIADEFLNVSGLLDDLANAIGIGNITSKINGIKDKLDKMADVADMIKKLKKIKSAINDVRGKIDTLGEKITAFVNAVNEKEQFVSQYGNKGNPPSAPDEIAKNETEYIYNTLSKIYDSIDKNNENETLNQSVSSDAQQYLSDLGIQFSYTENGQTLYKTNREVLNLLKAKMNYYGITSFSDWTKDNIKSSRDSANAAKKAQKKDYDAKKSDYDKYYKDISSKNRAITNACSNIATQIGEVKSSFNDYSNKLTEALNAINKVNEDLSTDGNGNENVTSAVTKIQTASTTFVTEFNKILSNFETAFASIDASNSANTIKNTIKNYTGIISFDDLKNQAVNKLKERVLEWSGSDGLKEIIKKLDDTESWAKSFWKMIKGIKTLASVLKPWPSFESSENHTDMNDSNWNITLGASHNVNNYQNPFAANDVSFINERINRGNEIAKNYTNVTDLKNQASPNDPMGNESSIIGSMIALGNSFKKLLDDFGNLFTSSITDTWENIKDIAGDVKDIFSSVLDICGQLVSLTIKSAYNNIMLTQYSRTYFKNRQSDSANDYDGNELHQLFYKAEQEYIIVGSSSESDNEKSVAIAIFTYRLINNVAKLASDTSAMSLISACNFLAPVVFAVWAYYETCIDCNLLFEGIAKLGLFKSKLWISAQSLANIAENVSSIDENDEPEEVIEKLIGGINDGRFGYDEYIMFMMLFISNVNKTQRIGDLIQWHVRYKSNSNFKLENTYSMFRVQTKVSLNPILPIINLSNSNKTGISSLTNIEQVFYEGY